MYHLVFNVFLYLNLCFLNVWCCGIPAIFFIVVSSLILKLFISNMFPLLFYTQPLFFLSPLHATWAPIASQSFLYIWSVVTFVSFQSFLQHIFLLLDDLLPESSFLQQHVYRNAFLYLFLSLLLLIVSNPQAKFCCHFFMHLFIVTFIGFQFPL